MKQATEPNQEAARLEALRQYNILDTPSEQAYDDFTLLASLYLPGSDRLDQSC